MVLLGKFKAMELSSPAIERFGLLLSDFTNVSGFAKQQFLSKGVFGGLGHLLLWKIEKVRFDVGVFDLTAIDARLGGMKVWLAHGLLNRHVLGHWTSACWRYLDHS